MYVIHAHICDNTEETHLLSNTFQLGIMLEVLFDEQGQAKEAGMRSLINVGMVVVKERERCRMSGVSVETISGKIR